MRQTLIERSKMSTCQVESGKRIAYYDYSQQSSTASPKEKAFIMSPGLGDLKEEYRFLGPRLAAAFPQYRVIAVDLRGMGESDVGFSSYTPEDTGNDLIALIRCLSLREIVLIGCSMSAASILIPATESTKASFQVKCMVFLSPFAWDHTMPFGIPTLLHLLLNSWTGPSFWTDYYKGLHTLKPSPVTDLDVYCKKVKANLRESNRRIEALRGHMFASKASCTSRIAKLSKDIPIVVIYGAKDPDFPDLQQEIKELCHYLSQIDAKQNVMVCEGVGHYPHVEAVEDVLRAIRNIVN